MDEQSKETVDTGLSDVTDTSNDEGRDPEADLLDIEITDEDMNADEDDANTDSTDEAATESEDEVEDESDSDVQEEKSEEEDTTSDEDTRRRNDEFAKQRIAEREARAQREALLAQTKQEQQESYLQEAEDARDLALRQLQIDAYNNRVETNASKLEIGIDRAVADIDIFRTGSDVEKEALARSLEDFERMYVRRDSNGDAVEVNGDVYQYLKAKSDEIRLLTGVGARTENKAKAKTKARTDVVPTRAPKEPRKDPYLAAFEEEASRP